MARALEKNIKFIISKITFDIKIFMEVFFKLMNLYPNLANFDDDSIIESDQESEREHQEECSEVKSDDSTDYSQQSDSQELSISSEDELEIMNSRE